jgi:hypothetical protein
MFRADGNSAPRAPLYLVAQGGPVGSTQGEKKMNTYRFANLPSNSAVDFSVTALVSVWFLVAAGAILSDPPSPYGHRYQAPALQAKAAPVIPPQARFTIIVEARRSAAL